MHKDQIPNINPNHVHGCHPSDLRDYFGETPFYPTIKTPKDPFPPVSRRLLLLKRILDDISDAYIPKNNLLPEDRFERYHPKYASVK